MQIHVDRNGERYGPYNLEEVNAYLENGTLLPTDHAWQENMTDWVEIGQVPGVVIPGGAATPTPPPSPSAGSTHPPALEPPSTTKKGFAIAGMVLGILAVLESLNIGNSPMIFVSTEDFMVVLVFGVTGLVFSRLSIKRKLGGKQMAKAGLICSIVGLVLGILFFATVEAKKAEIRENLDNIFNESAE